MTPLRTVVALLIAGAVVVTGQQGTIVTWELTGPSDGAVTDIIESLSGRLFAATTKGLYQSSDDGTHWTRCGEALGDFVLLLNEGQVLVGPTLTRKLSYVDGTCARVDTVTLSSAYSNQPVFGALARLNTGRLLASRWTFGLFASDDQGHQWRQMVLPPVSNGDWIFSFAIMPSGHIVAASNGSILRSSDNGDTWVRLARGTAPHSLAVGSLGALFGAGDGVSRSLDEGMTWQKIGFDRQTVWAVIAIGSGMPGSNSGALFAAVQRPDRFDSAVFRSTDGGVTWTPTGSELTGRVNVFAHTGKGSLIAGTTTGFFKSVDNGARWQFGGVAPAALNVIAADAEGMVVADSPGGWLSVDHGRTWNQILIASSESNRMVNAEPYYRRTLFISRAGRLYAGGQGGIVFSTDRGTTWRRAGLERDTFALSELSDGTLFAATYNGGIFRSFDQGETWVEHSIGLTEFMTIGLSALSSGSVIAATLHQTFLSTDSGNSWVPLTRGLPNEVLWPILPTGTASVAVVAVNATLYELDATNSWKVGLNLRSPITSLAWDDTRRLWIGTRNDGIAMALRGNEGWTASYVGPSTDAVFGLATSRGYVVATSAGGIVRAALPR